jgi:hypothetical protein
MLAARTSQPVSPDSACRTACGRVRGQGAQRVCRVDGTECHERRPVHRFPLPVPTASQSCRPPSHPARPPPLTSAASGRKASSRSRAADSSGSAAARSAARPQSPSSLPRAFLVAADSDPPPAGLGSGGGSVSSTRSKGLGPGGAPAPGRGPAGWEARVGWGDAAAALDDHPAAGIHPAAVPQSRLGVWRTSHLRRRCRRRLPSRFRPPPRPAAGRSGSGTACARRARPRRAGAPAEGTPGAAGSSAGSRPGVFGRWLVCRVGGRRRDARARAAARPAAPPSAPRQYRTQRAPPALPATLPTGRGGFSGTGTAGREGLRERLQGQEPATCAALQAGTGRAPTLSATLSGGAAHASPAPLAPAPLLHRRGGAAASGSCGTRHARTSRCARKRARQGRSMGEGRPGTRSAGGHAASGPLGGRRSAERVYCGVVLAVARQARP